MLQMFHLDVSKVDLGVAYVANGYACMFQVFHLIYVASIVSGCFKRRLDVVSPSLPSASLGVSSRRRLGI